MSQVSYGTITITDTTDIERIYTVYAKSADNTTVPSIAKESWSENVSTAPGSGNYIWQRTVVEKSGTGDKTYSDPVCLTGEEGTDATEISGIEVRYGISADWNTQPTSWSADTPAYDSSKPKYWTRTRLVYDTNPATYSDPVYTKDEALTKAVSDSAIANSIAAHANEDAQGAMSQATATQVAQEALASKLQRIWRNQNTYIYGNTYDGITWNKPNYPAGTYAASGIDGITFDEQDSSTYGFNSFLRHTFLSFRYNTHQLVTIGTGVATDDGGISGLAINTPIVDSTNKQVINVARGMELTSNSLTFYKPPTIDGTTVTPGGKAMELTGTALKFYRRDTTENTDVVNASFSADEIILGEAEKEHITIDDDGLKIYGRYNSFDPYGPVTPAHWGTIASFGIKTQIGTEDTGHVIIDETGAFFYNTGGSTLPYLVAKIGNEGDIVEYDDYQETYSTTWNLGETLNFSFSRGPSDSGSQNIKCYIKEGDNLTLCTSYITIDDDNYEYNISGHTEGGSADFIITSTTENTTRSVDLVIIITYDASFVGPHYSFGMNTNSVGRFSIATGQNTIALGKYQMVLGKFNEVKEDALFIIGNGTDDNNRSNLFVIDGEGNLSVQDGFKIISDENSELVLSSNGIDIKQNDVSLASFTTNGAQIGQNASGMSRAVISKDGMQIYSKWDNTDRQIVNFGYSPSSYTAYYTLGYRGVPTNTYDASKTYAVGDLCLDESQTQYVCNTVITEPEAWNWQHWSLIIGDYSFAEGEKTVAAGTCAHAEGKETVAVGTHSHTEGQYTVASDYSHAEGSFSRAESDYSHAEGFHTKATGKGSHAQNGYTIAAKEYQTVIGKFNIEDTATNSRQQKAFIIGNGASSARSNALTVDWNGNVDIASGAKYKINGSPLAPSDIGIHISTSAPTSSDGNNGDIWIVYSAN